MYDDYRALVGRQTTGFKKLFEPGSDFLAEDDGVVTLAGQCGDSFHLLWKIWIPPGVKSLQATMYVYHNVTPGKALMRFGQPPIGNANSVTPENASAVDLANVLDTLLAGAEVPCYTPEFGGSIKLSASMPSDARNNAGGWLYIKAVQVPGNKVYQLDARVTADTEKYNEWYASAVWDVEGNPVAGEVKPVEPPKPVEPVVAGETPQQHEARVYEMVKEAGLLQALSRLSGGLVNRELEVAAVNSGTWEVLLKLIK